MVCHRTRKRYFEANEDSLVVHDGINSVADYNSLRVGVVVVVGAVSPIMGPVDPGV